MMHSHACSLQLNYKLILQIYILIEPEIKGISKQNEYKISLKFLAFCLLAQQANIDNDYTLVSFVLFKLLCNQPRCNVNLSVIQPMSVLENQHPCSLRNICHSHAVAVAKANFQPHARTHRVAQGYSVSS